MDDNLIILLLENFVSNLESGISTLRHLNHRQMGKQKLEIFPC